MSPITLHLSEKFASTEISLCLSEGEEFPISRFPRSLLEDDDRHESPKSPIPPFFYLIADDCGFHSRNSPKS